MPPEKAQLVLSFIHRNLSPSDRLAEVVCGLVMVLTFTLTADFAIRDDPGALRELLLATIGCNIAWGLIDGVAYVMGRVASRDRGNLLLRTVQGARDKRAGLNIISAELDETFVSAADEAERAELYEKIHHLAVKTPVRTNGVRRDDFLGALAILLIDFLCTLPAAIPFLIFTDRMIALRVSNGLLVAMLFATGYRWAASTHGRPIRTGSVFAGIGLVLVGVAILLGG